MACNNITINLKSAFDKECGPSVNISFGSIIVTVKSITQGSDRWQFVISETGQTVIVPGTVPDWFVVGCQVQIDFDKNLIMLYVPEKKHKNLIEGLTNEILRVTEISKEYKSLPGGAGMLAAAIMDDTIDRARKAQASGDILQMIPILKDLQEFEL